MANAGLAFEFGWRSVRHRSWLLCQPIEDDERIAAMVDDGQRLAISRDRVSRTADHLAVLPGDGLQLTGAEPRRRDRIAVRGQPLDAIGFEPVVPAHRTP